MHYIYQPLDDLIFCISELGQNVKKWPKSDLSEATSDFEIEGQGHKTIAFVVLPIYTHIPNLKGLTKIFLSYHVQKEISAAELKSPDKILKLMVNMTRSKVKPKSHHDVAHLQLPTNVPTKYQLQG